MAGPAMVRHVVDGVSRGNEGIQVGQRADKAPDQQRPAAQPRPQDVAGDAGPKQELR